MVPEGVTVVLLLVVLLVAVVLLVLLPPVVVALLAVIWGHFQQHAYAQLLRAQMLWPSTSISPTKLGLTLTVFSTRNYAQLLHCILSSVHQ